MVSAEIYRVCLLLPKMRQKKNNKRGIARNEKQLQ
jgi:hypothetical protein